MCESVVIEKRLLAGSADEAPALQPPPSASTAPQVCRLWQYSNIALYVDV